MPTAQEFFATWHFSLVHDFETDGATTPWFPGHPKQWGSELTRIEFPTSESVSFVALREEDSLLAIAAGDNIYIYTMERSQDTGEVRIIPRKVLKGGHGGKVGTLALQPRAGGLLVSSGHFLSDHRSTHTVRAWNLSEELTSKESLFDDDDKDLISAAASAAAKAASQVLVPSAAWWPRVFEGTEIEQHLDRILRVAQMKADIRQGRVLEGSIGTFESRVFSRDGTFMIVFAGGDGDRNFVAVVEPEGLRERCRLVGHSDSIMWAESNPDDTVIATSSWDKTVRLWNAVTGEPLHILTGATNQSWSAAFSPDGKLIAAGSGDRHVRVWNVDSGELVHTLSGFNSWIRSFCFSPDGTTLAAGADGGTLRVFDVLTGENLQYWQVAASKAYPKFGSSFIEIRRVQYTVHGILIFKADDGRVFTFDPKKGEKGQFEPGPDVPGHQGVGTCVVSRDGTTLFSVDFDNVVRVWGV